MLFRSSQLSSVPACQRTVKKAVVKRLMRAHRVTTLPEVGAEYRIEIALLRDQASLTLDTSGVGLHKRGYRTRPAPAPIKETLAELGVKTVINLRTAPEMERLGFDEKALAEEAGRWRSTPRESWSAYGQWPRKLAVWIQKQTGVRWDCRVARLWLPKTSSGPMRSF